MYKVISETVIFYQFYNLPVNQCVKEFIVREYYSYPHEQSIKACCDNLTNFPVFKKYAPSIAPIVPNDQQEPHTD